MNIGGVPPQSRWWGWQVALQEAGPKLRLGGNGDRQVLLWFVSFSTIFLVLDDLRKHDMNFIFQDSLLLRLMDNSILGP